MSVPSKTKNRVFAPGFETTCWRVFCVLYVVAVAATQLAAAHPGVSLFLVSLVLWAPFTAFVAAVLVKAGQVVVEFVES